MGAVKYIKVLQNVPKKKNNGAHWRIFQEATVQDSITNQFRSLKALDGHK
jgi:hypothetical protein